MAPRASRRTHLEEIHKQALKRELEKRHSEERLRLSAECVVWMCFQQSKDDRNLMQDDAGAEGVVPFEERGGDEEDEESIVVRGRVEEEESSEGPDGGDDGGSRFVDRVLVNDDRKTLEDVA